MKTHIFLWRWFVSEYKFQEDGDIMFFGYVCRFEKERGYFNLSELERTRFSLLVDCKFKDAVFGGKKEVSAMKAKLYLGTMFFLSDFTLGWFLDLFI
jgi:hypothetical protein